MTNQPSNRLSPSQLLSLPLLGCAMILCGCNSSASNSGSNQGTAGADSSQANSLSRDLLDSAVAVMDVNSLGISTSADAGVSLMNQAFANSSDVSDEISSRTEESAATWEKLLSEEEREFAASNSLTGRDGIHIWDALLSHKIAAAAIGSAQSELQRVANAFDFTVRNLQLIERHPAELPLTLQEIWTLGRGTAQDRAWAFAELMRQMNIDTVLLYPADANDSADGPFLVAVLLDGQVYLFDPRLGIPVPSPNPESIAATLTEVLSQPELLAKLSTDSEKPYPLTGDQLKNPTVKLIGDAGTWAPRMKAVENAFDVDQRPRCYEGLADHAGNPGYLSRVASAGNGNWSAESISVWDYPESQSKGHSQLTVNQQDALRSLKDSLKASWEGKIEKKSQSGGFFASPRSQFAARQKQLTGDFGGAVRIYVQIGKTNAEFKRLAKGEFVPQLIPEPPKKQSYGQGSDRQEREEKERWIKEFQGLQRLSPTERRGVLANLQAFHKDNMRQHDSAAKDAKYWVGVAQFESGNHKAAGNTFRRYLKQVPDGSWTAGCRYYLAAIHAAEGDYAAAADILAETAPSNPSHAGHQALSRLWRERASQDAS